MKTLFIFLISIVLVSCQHGLDNNTGAKIYHFESGTSNRCTYWCNYMNGNFGGGEIDFIDTCGKYQIGDIIKVTKY